ncbi:MAG: DUF4097 family beta strand repeat-containing protein [Steroidobacteraceae bacterium]|jgi:DUF4097 and DUF4098 domain-containing protein YvlB
MPIVTPKLMTPVIAAALCLIMVPWSIVHAASEFKQTSSADPQGSIEIDVMSGSVEIDGWDRPEVEVTGQPDDLADRVRVSTSGDKTTIHVTPYSIHGNSSEDIHLIVHVPAKSGLTTSLVNASVKVQGLQGDAYLRTISGSISGEVSGDLRVNTVTGTVHLSAPSAKRIEIKTISGNVQLTGGPGEAEVTTVSGKVQADLGSLTRGRFKSISGDVTANYSLAQNAEIEGESVSGTIRFGFASTPGADFDVQSFSGTIDNCFGPKPTQAQYGPGSKLIFKSGDGHGNVRIATKSGDIKLCTGSAHTAPAA